MKVILITYKRIIITKITTIIVIPTTIEDYNNKK